ncbi:MAG: type II toxin-antitoxin system RelE/ParE family toxin [Bacteroidota bacterium]
MRDIDITPECLAFIDKQEERVVNKFFQLLEVMTEVKVISTNFVKKLVNSPFYELRIRAGNEYRILLFSADHPNFIESNRIICLYGFKKKSTKDYDKAIRKAEKILADYLEEEEE